VEHQAANDELAVVEMLVMDDGIINLIRQETCKRQS